MLNYKRKLHMWSAMRWMPSAILILMAVAMLQKTSYGQYKADANATLKIGNKIPLLSGTDQFGQERNFVNLKGPNGLVILFFRSADWCPYCKGQLLSLQRAAARFKEKGIGLAGVSYDSVDILKFFTDRYSISYPLLSDPKSQVIERFG